MQNPCLRCDLDAIRHNIDALITLCHSRSIKIAAVTKVICAHPDIVRVIDESEVDQIADSRILNLASMHTQKPRLLTRIAMPSEAEDVVRHSELSLQSEVVTIRALASAAKHAHRRHGVILMIDLGDLREGVFYTDTEGIERAAREIASASHLDFAGIGTNLTCYGAILPSTQNLQMLVNIAEQLRALLDLPIPLISGGNSSSLGLVAAGGCPREVNHLRIGEAMFLGTDTATGNLLQGLRDDAFTLAAELVELKRKPSVPIGESYANAFGERVTFADEGEQLRGIAAVGRQDIAVEGLVPVDPRVRILGASSDHLLLDLGVAKEYAVGSMLAFRLRYGALLQAATSAYVEKEMQLKPICSIVVE